MLTAGSYHDLEISRISDHGVYLIDKESAEEVLLPNRYVSLTDKAGDLKRVFIYHDSENRLIATTEDPLVKASEAAYLQAVDMSIHGAFFDWGVTAKDLFVPNSNLLYKVEPGRKYVIYAYRDNVSGRLTGSTKLNGFISNAEIAVSPREEVDILVALRVNAGYRVIINNRNWGMIYDNQVFRPIAIGDRMRGYVRKISEDNRIDISLQREGFDEVKVSAYKLMKLVEEGGGRLALNDSSAPETVARVTNMSKKVFKRSLGFLMSHELVKMEDGVIVAIKRKG